MSVDTVLVVGDSFLFNSSTLELSCVFPILRFILAHKIQRLGMYSMCVQLQGNPTDDSPANTLAYSLDILGARLRQAVPNFSGIPIFMLDISEWG